jgi:hypothetical protein
VSPEIGHAARKVSGAFKGGLLDGLFSHLAAMVRVSMIGRKPLDHYGKNAWVREV